jgi:hypothetical protein
MFVRTVLCEALQDGANAHDQRPHHDGHAPSKPLVEPRSNRDGNNGSELVTGRDESKQRWPDVGLLGLWADVAIAKVWFR